MRKLLTTGVLALSLSLGACATNTQITAFLAQVQADAAIACQFVPTIDTILAISASLGFAPATAAAAAVGTVANAICKQVPPPASAAFKALPTDRSGFAGTAGAVNGIAITGWRTH